MLTTPLNQLRAHPAQMRTRYDLDELAALTLQVYQRGLDSWHPILVSPIHGANQTEGTEGYHIVSGHRRYMAYVLAQAYLTAHTLQTTQTPDGEEVAVSLESMRQFIGQLVEQHGTLETAVSELLTFLGQEKISVLLFEGSPKAEILSLQAANYGGEKPDMLGIAYSFRQAVEAGATPEEIGRNCGQPLVYVRNHLALTEVATELAERIAAGELPLSVATAVASLPDPKRTGLTLFILANEPGKITAKSIEQVANSLKKWSGLQQPLLVKHQTQRNIARAVVRLWQEAVEAIPADAYAAASLCIYKTAHEDPWATPEKLNLWFQVLGGEGYFADGQIQWEAVVAYLLPEISCQACPIARLPQPAIHCDLVGLPCRRSAEPGQVERCLHGLTAHDPFDVRVPWEWSRHPGVVHDGEYRVRSVEDLLRAWQAQADEERGARSEERETQLETHNPSASSEQAPELETPNSELETRNSELGTPSPITKQRALIADYMKRHESMAASHPFATPCGSCQHWLEGSPTKDEEVPHCRWARRVRTVVFKRLCPADSNAPTLPVCWQYAPTLPWQELIPPHPKPLEIPRDWLKENILQLVKDANGRYTERKAFEFLTGRPLSSGEPYGNWFETRLNEQIGTLSDAQLCTLFIWAMSEWRRAHHGWFPLPVNGMQFVSYQELPWDGQSG